MSSDFQRESEASDFCGSQRYQLVSFRKHSVSETRPLLFSELAGSVKRPTDFSGSQLGSLDSCLGVQTGLQRTSTGSTTPGSVVEKLSPGV